MNDITGVYGQHNDKTEDQHVQMGTNSGLL